LQFGDHVFSPMIIGAIQVRAIGGNTVGNGTLPHQLLARYF